MNIIRQKMLKISNIDHFSYYTILIILYFLLFYRKLYNHIVNLRGIMEIEITFKPTIIFCNSHFPDVQKFIFCNSHYTLITWISVVYPLKQLRIHLRVIS